MFEQGKSACQHKKKGPMCIRIIIATVVMGNNFSAFLWIFKKKKNIIEGEKVGSNMKKE